MRFGILDNFYSDTGKKMSLNTKYYFFKININENLFPVIYFKIYCVVVLQVFPGVITGGNLACVTKFVSVLRYKSELVNFVSIFTQRIILTNSK